MASGATLAAQEPASSSGPREIPPATGPVEIDGRLDDPAWAEAARITLDYEWFPGDNVRPPVATEAWLTYDSRRLYVAFRAHDPEPDRIRAHLMDRDDVRTFSQDDHVRVMFDTFNDERRAYQFRVNPLGVQVDAIFSQVEFIEDTSWDCIWDSAGRIDEGGYSVELAIPFNQLRFPAGRGAQVWGVELGRSYPRSRRHRITAEPRDRDNTCLLCQASKVRGFEGIEPGANLEVAPTLTASRTEERSGFPGGSLESEGEDFEPGVTARWSVTPSLTFSGTANPDFSHVEADAAQLAVNERFALFFEEKRPFFLEGIDLFSTPIQAVFTRTVVNPDWGAKFTGKLGHNAGGAFITEDSVNGLLIPSNQQSAVALLAQSVLGTVLRYRRDVRRDSTLGMVYTGREGDGYHNRVGGVDGFVRLAPTDEVRFQFLRSETLYPEALAVELDQRTDAFSGNALRIAYDHNARNWLWSLSYDDLDAGFRADSGFVPRVDVRTGSGSLVRRVWGKEGAWFSNYDLGVAGLRTEDQEGRLTDEVYQLTAALSASRQSNLSLTLENATRFFRGTLHEDLQRVRFGFTIQPGASAFLSLDGVVGEAVDFTNNLPADLLELRPAVELKLGRRTNAQLSHVFQRLEVEEGELTEAHLSQVRLVYNLSVRSFIRAIAQYTTVERDAALSTVPVETDEERLFTQLLFSYKVNPRTVLFVGYSDNHLGTALAPLTTLDRTLFVKLGYAWVR